MDRRLAAERRTSKLRAAIGDDLVHVHVELCSAAGHPDVQREHVRVLARKDLLAYADDQWVLHIVETARSAVCVGRTFLKDGVGGDHFPRDEIRADAEMFERALRLRAPELVGWDGHVAQGIPLDPRVCLIHGLFPPYRTTQGQLGVGCFRFCYALCLRVSSLRS